MKTDSEQSWFLFIAKNKSRLTKPDIATNIILTLLPHIFKFRALKTIITVTSDGSYI